MNDVIDLASARATRAAVPSLPVDSETTYRDAMAQVRALHRVRGFRSDRWTTAILTPAYRALLRRAGELAPSRAIFDRDLRLADRCKTS